jgi:hypothetical protein
MKSTENSFLRKNARRLSAITSFVKELDKLNIETIGFSLNKDDNPSSSQNSNNKKSKTESIESETVAISHIVNTLYKKSNRPVIFIGDYPGHPRHDKIYRKLSQNFPADIPIIAIDNSILSTNHESIRDVLNSGFESFNPLFSSFCTDSLCDVNLNLIKGNDNSKQEFSESLDEFFYRKYTHFLCDDPKISSVSWENLFEIIEKLKNISLINYCENHAINELQNFMNGSHQHNILYSTLNSFIDFVLSGIVSTSRLYNFLVQFKSKNSEFRICDTAMACLARLEYSKLLSRKAILREKILVILYLHNIIILSYYYVHTA